MYTALRKMSTGQGGRDTNVLCSLWFRFTATRHRSGRATGGPGRNQTRGRRRLILVCGNEELPEDSAQVPPDTGGILFITCDSTRRSRRFFDPDPLLLV